MAHGGRLGRVGPGRHRGEHLRVVLRRQAAPNTAYKVVYSGYTDPDQGTYGDNYAPSESAPFTVGVARKITRTRSGFVIKGKVTPDYAQEEDRHPGPKKEKKGYKKFKTIKTNKKGKYKVTAAPPRRHLVLVVHGQGRRQVPGQRLRLAHLGLLTHRYLTHVRDGPAEHPLSPGAAVAACRGARTSLTPRSTARRAAAAGVRPRPASAGTAELGLPSGSASD